jgi:hypothetical protein
LTTKSKNGILLSEREVITMSKLIGVTKLNKAITKELKQFGVSEAKLSDEYAYYFDDESVTYKITENDLSDMFFTSFIKERFDYTCPYPFVLSLLHEVGHHKANDEIEGAIYEFCIAEKERITALIEQESDMDKVQAYEYQYFNLPDEIMATQWAVNFAKAHPKKIANMWHRMKEALFKFYADNGVFEGLSDDEDEI